MSLGSFVLRMGALLLLLAPGPDLLAKKKKKGDAEAKPAYDAQLFKGLEYRMIGPFRGGRSAAVTGVPGQPTTFYFGGTGGGVWVTHDGGSSWRNISDGFFGGSIGAVAVSEWDPNVIYAGGGEKTVRGNVSHGYGMWKSTDRGKTWRQIGLTDTRHIPRIRIHPRNPDLVYVAAMGHLFGPNEERGVFRSADGGETWEKILFVNDEVGAVDLILDPTNPRIVYASFWRIKRTPYSLESGGEGSGLWKSVDGGDTWTEITRKPGLPKGMVGIIGVTVSPVDGNRLWAIVESAEGGVFRSDDGGETWTKTNEDRNLRQRAWYYTRIYADTKSVDTVYVVNVQFWRSKDGGRTFSSISTPHGDHHDLWIDPDEPQRMVVADDGGAQVTYDGGDSWTTYHNQPTAQFYRVTTDNHFPYRIYGAQQDNSTVRILHRTDGGAITERDWEPTAGGESGHIAPHPEDPDIVYGGSYGGFLTRVNHRTNEIRAVNVWPENPMGHGAADLKYRFQWNFPIFFSPHDPDILYAAGNVLFKSENEGQSWTAISPDLTRDDKSKQGPSGGPITKDNTSVEYYCTIFAAAESTHEPGVIWAGSDDGLVHITRDGGANWENVTPADLPEWTQINSIEIDPFNKGGLYLAGTRYKLDDFQPYLYKTEDYGKTWKKIVKGIPADHFTRVVRADPKRQGLLYSGTETGLYASFNDGANWQPFQLNLPIVPITDLAVKNDDLVVATQGRSFWVLDDLTPLHQMQPGTAAAAALYRPRPTYRMGGGRFRRGSGNAGENLQSGVIVNFHLAEWGEDKAAETGDEAPAKAENGEGEDAEAGDKAKKKPEKTVVKLTFKEADGTVIKTYSSDAKERGEKLEPSKGFNRFYWNMRYPNAEDFKGMIMWSGGVGGPRAVPGTYQVELSVGDWSHTEPFEILKDPRSQATQADLQAQFDYLISVRDKLSETHKAIQRIRKVRAQVDRAIEPMKGKEDHKAVVEAAKELKKKMTEVEEALYQTKNRSRQDPLNFPIRLNDKLAGLNRIGGIGDFRPSEQLLAVREELTTAIDAELAKLETILTQDVAAFNDLVAAKNMPAVWLEEEKK